MYLYEHVEDIVAEMAGLPIVVDGGSVIGVVSNTREPADEHWVGMQPRLTEVLPRWLLQCSMISQQIATIFPNLIAKPTANAMRHNNNLD